MEDKDKIEQLKKRLYSISEEPPELHRSGLRHHANQVADSFTQEGENTEQPKTLLQKKYISRYDDEHKSPILKRVLLISLFALIAASIFAWYVYVTGGNYISSDNIDVKVVGPVATPAGEVLTLDIDIFNGNSEALQAVDLIIQYPEGTRIVSDRATNVLSDRLPIGEIARGDTQRRRIQVILFGEENVKKELKMTVEYRVPGSIILFRKEKIYPIFIGSAPVSIEVTNFKEVVPNQSTTFKAVVTSNSKDIIRNLIFKAEYPSGFKYEKGTPAPTNSNDTWVLGDLNPGDKREISIQGQIVGDANIERFFGFTAGTQDPLDANKIGIKLVESKEKVAIKRPFLAGDISLNKVGSATFVGTAGEQIRGEIIWQNNLDVPVYDAILELKLNGVTLDKKEVEADGGFYSSQNNLITWDRNLVPALAEIQPGVSGNFQFALASLPPTPQNNSNFRRQTITLELNIRAKRLSENRVPEEIKSNTTRTIKIASGLALSSRLVRNVGPFENTGPIPPAAEETSTYTVMNSVTNSFNSVGNLVYTAKIPSYVTWLGKVYPESSASNVKYNADTREITWNLGDIAPGVGFNSSAREFSYQVSITPSVSQVSTEPIVIQAARIAGTDTFVEGVVENSVSALTTNIFTDPQFQYGYEKVVE